MWAILVQFRVLGNTNTAQAVTCAESSYGCIREAGTKRSGSCELKRTRVKLD